MTQACEGKDSPRASVTLGKDGAALLQGNILRQLLQRAADGILLPGTLVPVTGRQFSMTLSGGLDNVPVNRRQRTA